MSGALLILLLMGRAMNGDGAFAHGVSQTPLEPIRQLIERGELEEAARRLYELKAAHPQDPDVLRLLGEVSRRQGRWDEALAHYQAVLARVPDDLEATFWIATLHRWKGNVKDALAAYDRVLAQAPQHVDARLGRARIFLHLERWADAEADVRVALAAAPQSEEAIELWMSVLLRTRRFQEAEAWLQEHPEVPGRDRWLGDLRMAQGRVRDAIAAYTRATAQAPQDVALLRALADAYRRSGKVERALELYRQVADRQPQDAEAYFWIGTLCRWRGDVRAAEDAFRQALRLQPRHVEALLGLARIALAREDLSQAEQWLDRARALDPTHPEVAALRGQLLERRGQRREALQEYQRALERAPQEETALAGYWRLQPLLHPTLELSYERQETDVLEGRADRIFEIPVTRIRYRLEHATVRARYPLGETWALHGSFRGARDQVANRSGGFDIYDFTIWTPALGLEGQLSPRWSLTGEIGASLFQNNATGSVPEEDFLTLAANLSWSAPNDRFAVDFRRGPFLGRSFAADVRFGIFVENRVGAAYDRRLSPTLSTRTEYAFARYSDGNRTHAVHAFLRYEDARKAAIVGYRLIPLQARFLKPENTLDFLRVHQAFLAARWEPHPEWSLRADLVRAWYQDRNWQWSARALMSYRPRALRVVELGTSYFRDWYARDALRYNTLTIRTVMPYIALKQEARPRWSYELRYGYAWLSDEATARYWAHEAAARLASWMGTRSRLGVEARYWRDTLTQRTWRAFIFWQWLF
jgi:tetratricopeptide (TPR) repeat protein